jgi:hypothetical protein
VTQLLVEKLQFQPFGEKQNENHIFIPLHNGYLQGFIKAGFKN